MGRFRPLTIGERAGPAGAVLASLTRMVCRIDVAEEHGGCTVHISGRLAKPGVADLLRVCTGHVGALRIDLTNMLSIDADGIDALRRLVENGAELLGVAEYLRHELRPQSRAT